MHHKFVVIDGKTVILSSANFTPSCIHGDVGVAGSRGNDNALMVVESPAFARIFNEEFMLMNTARFGINKPFRGARSVNVAGKKLTVQFSPTSRRVDWSQSTNGLIAQTLSSARSSVHAALFVFSEQGIADSLRQVKDRADIRVLVERKFAFRFFSEVLDLLGVELPDFRCTIPPFNAPWTRPIQHAGTVKNLPGDVLHHKFAVVDQQKVIFGSHNWSEAANSSNDEFLVVVEDQQTAHDFVREYRRVEQRSEYGLPHRIKEDIRRLNEYCGQNSF
jgi:phosphatidylserine/phosphatidylglycerophosphate/cardiolipin synthase-like enzyme